MKPAVKRSRDPRPISEFDLHLFVVELLRVSAKRGVKFFHCPNGEVRHKATALKLSRMGVLPGVSDLCIVMPGRWLGFLELKSAKGRLSDAQRLFLNDMKANGFLTAVTSSPDEARDILVAWGAIRPEAKSGRTN